MANIGNRPTIGQKPWDLWPAIDAVNTESTATSATVNTGRLSDTSVKSLVKSYVGISVADFGVLPSNPDNLSAIQTAHAASKTLFWPPGDYAISGPLNINLNGVRWFAEGARLVHSSRSALVSITSAVDAIIDGLGLYSSRSDTLENSASGLILIDRSTVRDFTWKNATFTAPGYAVNGVKVIVDNVTTANLIQRMVFSNIFYNQCGRMAFEVQDHSTDKSIVRVVDCAVEDSTFYNNGQLSQGIDVSWSGDLSGIVTQNNRFVGTRTTCIEYVGKHTTPRVVGNTFQSLVGACAPIAFTNPTNNTRSVGAVFSRNRSLDRSGGASNLRNLDGWFSEANYLTPASGAGMNFTNVSGGNSVSDKFDTTGVYALYVEGTSSYNRWQKPDLTTRGGAFAVIRFYGVDTVYNTVEDAWINLQDGSVMDEQNSAFGNSVVRYRQGTGAVRVYLALSVAAGNITLSPTQADSEVLEFTGAPADARTVTIRRDRRRRMYKNSSGQTITLTTGVASSLTITIPAGQTVGAITDGTNVYAA